MHNRQFGLLVSILTSVALGLSAPLRADSPLSALTVEKGGAIILAGDDYRLEPWSWRPQPGTVQVVQYIPGTSDGNKLFKSLNDRMQRELDYTRYQLTVLVNLDAASWATRGIVKSRLVDKKRSFPGTVMVRDDDGLGVDQWQLPEGLLFAIFDSSGALIAKQTRKPSEEDLTHLFEQLQATLAEVAGP